MNKYKENRDNILNWFKEIQFNDTDDYRYLQWTVLSNLTWDNFSTSGYGIFTLAVVAASVIQTLKYQLSNEEFVSVFGEYIEIMSIPDESGTDRIPYLDPIQIIQLGLGEVNLRPYIPRKKDVMGFFGTLKAVIDRRKEVEDWHYCYYLDDEDDEDPDEY